jgi:hypothetical protein
MPGPIPRYEDVDPRTLYVNSQRPYADPAKFAYQLSRFGKSLVGMPAIVVWEDPDGRLLIANGMTRAVRAAKFSPGVLVRVEVTVLLKRPLKYRVLVADALP